MELRISEKLQELINLFTDPKERIIADKENLEQFRNISRDFKIVREGKNGGLVFRNIITGIEFERFDDGRFTRLLDNE